MHAQILYHSTYENIWAIHPNGTIIWHQLTGLKLVPAPLPEGTKDHSHVWGCNYHPQTDSITILTADAKMLAFDRITGRHLLHSPFQLPGSPSKNLHTDLPARFVVRGGNRESDGIFGKTKRTNQSVNQMILNAIFGDGTRVANFYCIDPNTGHIFVAATAPDEDDGVYDGFSYNGALYKIELYRHVDKYDMRVLKSHTFPGGTGSTPTMSPDSTRMLVSDDNNNVIALDQDLNVIWTVDVGGQVAASVACSQDNREVYAVTKEDIIKIQDNGINGASIVWRANLDAYPGFINVNALTPTITANGIVVSIAANKRLPLGLKGQLTFAYGMALLDKVTGNIRYFSQGVEESIAVSVVGPDGSYYNALSPVRHSMTKGFVRSIPFINDRIPEIRGGIQKYKPTRYDVLARDAFCAALDRVENMKMYADHHVDAAKEDLMRVKTLFQQGQNSAVIFEQHVREGKHKRIIQHSEDTYLKLIRQAAGLLSQSYVKTTIDALAFPLQDLCSIFDVTY
jgi:hypothetical protein